MEENRNQQMQAQSCNGPLRKCLRFLRGMPFSFVLLFIIAAACVAGSIIPQDGAAYTYVERYGAGAGRLITALQLDHVFTSWWFILLAALLCLNLILCSVSRFPAVYRAWKTQGKPFGIWGSWITHLGMLLLIVTFALGQYLTKESVVYGIAGSTQPLGDTGLYLTIDDFRTLLRHDYTVEQYVSALTVTDSAGEKRSGEASVNHPFDAFGYSFYQDSTGWASYVDIYRDAGEAGTSLVKTDLICVGEYTYPDEFPGLALLFNNYYPDFAVAEDGSFYSKTPLGGNPHLLYSVYFNGRVVDMNLVMPDEKIDANGYFFIMHEPLPYTLIVARSNPMVPYVAASAGILLLGLVLSFYVRPWEENRRKQHADESDPDNG